MTESAAAGPVRAGTTRRPALVVLSRRGRASLAPPAWAALEAVADVRVVQRNDAPDPDDAAALLAGADLLGATNLCLPRLDEPLLARLPQLSGVVLYATGYDLVDVPLLRRKGVGLSVLPDYATGAVAEHTLALLLGLATRLHLAQDRSRGTAPRGASLRGVELTGRSLGIVGVGRIGARTAQLAQAFGMRVLGCDPDLAARTRAAGLDIEVVELHTLLRRSDAVALTASSSFGDPPILGAAQLRRLRPGALLVNPARSSLVDTRAVVAALRAGQLQSYAVDDIVLDPALDGDLLDQGRVLQTGHSAWWRDEVLERGACAWGKALLAAAVGRPLDAVTWPRGLRPGQAPLLRPAPSVRRESMPA
jgi:phosphoglycerate dehydrogenase-like enzyme